MQVAITSDAQGHHFDIFIDDQFDVRLTEPNKVQGNADSLYAGFMLAGGLNNNITEFTFFRYSDDTVGPNQVGDLLKDSATPTSMTVTWTAPGDDDSVGTASRYDIRYSTSPITEFNYANSIRALGEPAPSPAGTQEFFTITGLEPDTRYWIALTSDDGFPQRNVSPMSNVATGFTADNIAPAAVGDLAVASVTARTALLTFTATGDNDTVGVADSYDIRYSTSPITESNFLSATQAFGEPVPSPSGSAEQFTVGGLEPGTLYYFAVKAIDEASNASPLSNVPFQTTAVHPRILDDFERPNIGPDWVTDPEFIVNNGELSNESLEELWDFVAVYGPVSDAEDVSIRWGTNADRTGIGEGGLALMLDSPSPDANGYLIFRHRVTEKYALWAVKNGAPDSLIANANGSTPYPQAGDVFEVVVSSDANGHHFDCYVNGVYDARVSDPSKAYGNGAQLWYGVMLHGNRNNNIEDFWISGEGANLPPGPFSLLAPANGDTIPTGAPLLDWQDSEDPNEFDSVLYTLYYSTSPVFHPDSTTIVDSLAASEYAIPPMGIVSLVRGDRTSSPVKGTGDASTLRVNLRKGPVTESPDGGDVPSPDLLPDNATIYWKVVAFDNGGLATGSTQSDWSFLVSIPEPPLPFSLLSPADGDTVETVTPVLTWENSSDPDPGDDVTYTLWYDDNPTFDSPVVIGGLTETSFATPTLNNETSYWWKVFAVDGDQLETESSETFGFYVLIPTGIGDEGGERLPGIPKAFALAQNYPNPFNPSTSIRFDIPAVETSGGAVPVRLEVFSLRGQRVRTIVDDVREPGRYVAHWDGRNDQGERVGSGIYLYRIQAGTFGAARKMVILK
jgi:hypothetical protein